MELTRPESANDLALMLSAIAQEKKANEIIIMNLTEIEFAPAEYFVLCSCDSDSQINAIVNEIRKDCNALDMDFPNFEGIENSYWVIADFFDTVFHIMHKDARNYYQIERIWADAKFYRVEESGEIKSLTEFDHINYEE